MKPIRKRLELNIDAVSKARKSLYMNEKLHALVQEVAENSGAFGVSWNVAACRLIEMGLAELDVTCAGE